MQLIPNIYYRD